MGERVGAHSWPLGVELGLVVLLGELWSCES